MRLDDYLDAAMGAEWRWGVRDCCFFGGNWIRAATARDPLEPYRGLYDSALGARRLIGERGGLVAMVGAEMARCSFARTDSPDHGDIAVVEMPGDGEHSAARASVVILDGCWWTGTAPSGVAWFKADPLAAWRVR